MSNRIEIARLESTVVRLSESLQASNDNARNLLAEVMRLRQELSRVEGEQKDLPPSALEIRNYKQTITHQTTELLALRRQLDGLPLTYTKPNPILAEAATQTMVDSSFVYEHSNSSMCNNVKDMQLSGLRNVIANQQHWMRQMQAYMYQLGVQEGTCQLQEIKMWDLCNQMAVQDRQLNAMTLRVFNAEVNRKAAERKVQFRQKQQQGQEQQAVAPMSDAEQTSSRIQVPSV